MSIKDGTLNLSFGLISEPLSKQIKKEGYKLPKNIKYLDKCVEASKTLKFLLPDSLNEKIVQKLNKEIVKSVKEVN